MSALELKVYEIFKGKFSEEEAKTVIEYFEQKSENTFAQKKKTMASKEDLANTKVDLIKWMVGFWIAQMAAIIGLYLKV